VPVVEEEFLALVRGHFVDAVDFLGEELGLDGGIAVKGFFDSVIVEGGDCEE
jgi:hypothetical protein